MPTAIINGKEVTVPRGTPIIRAAAQLGIDIPHFCYHPALSVPGNCRMCLVEVEGARKLEPACYFKVEDGMKIHTENDKVHTARRAVLEFILINHPVDCPICDKAGECKLQDYYMAYDAQPSRLTTNKVAKAKVVPVGPHVVLDAERCILCTRCVRFCDEITGTSELVFVERGDRSELRTFPGKELDNPYSMNVTDVCPVGALTTRDFRFNRRVWRLSSTNSICTGCAKGCNIYLDHHQGQAERYRPRFNADVNEYWMCDEGRLSYKRIHSDRLTTIRVGDEEGISWPRAARKVAQQIKASGYAPEEIVFVASAQASTESLIAAQTWVKDFLGTEQIYWSGKPDGHADDFLISADKNPNRSGVALVLGEAAFKNDAHALLEKLEQKTTRLLVMMGDDLPFDAETRKRFDAVLPTIEHFVLIAPHGNALAKAAWAVLPAATHAEEDGTFINEEGFMQPYEEAFAPLEQALPAWDIFVRLAHGADEELSVSSFADLQQAIESKVAAE